MEKFSQQLFWGLVVKPNKVKATLQVSRYDLFWSIVWYLLLHTEVPVREWSIDTCIHLELAT